MDFLCSIIHNFQAVNYSARDLSRTKTKMPSDIEIDDIPKIRPELDICFNDSVNTNELKLIVNENDDRTNNFECYVDQFNPVGIFGRNVTDEHKILLEAIPKYSLGPCMCSTESFYISCLVSMFSHTKHF